jgi:hypothetical protein
VCYEDPETFEECLEGSDGGGFACGFDCLCRYGGELLGELLFCTYTSQCLEGMDFAPDCDELLP